MTRFLVFLIVMFFAQKAMASDELRILDYPTPIAELFEKAVQYGGYEGKCAARNGCPPPAVLIVNLDDENQSGRFNPREPNFVSIAFDVVPGSVSFNAAVVHEFVHYLQWLHGELGPQHRCEQMMDIEVPAYKAASLYLAEFGIVEKFADQLFSVAAMSSACQMGFVKR